MYYVRDLINNACVKSGSMTDVAYWWRRKAGRNFAQLNITGKGTLTVMEKDGRLRSYQVLDEHDRSIDIRAWPKSVWEHSPVYPPYYWPCGFKGNHHRVSGPSMWRRTYQAALDGVDEAELLIDGLPLPIQDNTGVRLPSGGIDGARNYYDHHYYRRKSKSWKAQTKARKQWAKHKGKGERREDDWARFDRELAMFLAEDFAFFSEEAAA